MPKQPGNPELRAAWTRFVVELCPDEKFGKDNTIVLDSAAPIKAARDGGNFESKLSLKILKDLGTLEIVETWIPTAVLFNYKDRTSQTVAVKISLPASKMKLMLDAPTKNNANVHQFGWEILQNRGITQPREERVHAYLQKYIPQMCVLKQMEDKLAGMKCVRLSVIDPSKVPSFDLDQVRKIMAGVTKKTIAEVGNELMQQHESCLRDEIEEEKAKLLTLARDGCTGRISLCAKSHRNKDMAGKLLVSITPPPSQGHWAIEIGMRVSLHDKTFFTRGFIEPKKDKPDTTDKDAQPNAEDVVDEDAEESADDDDPPPLWFADVVDVQDNQPIVAVEQNMDQDEIARFVDMNVLGLSVRVIDSNRMHGRLLGALQTTDKILRYERGELTEKQIAKDPNPVLRVRMTPLLIDHPDVQLDNLTVSPFPLLGGQTALTYYTAQQMTDANIRFVNAVHNGKGGYAALVGPPGTGKSTTLAKMTAIALNNFDLKDGKIVLCAHSNQATSVLLQKCHEVFPAFGLDPDEELVWVESFAATKRRQNPVFGLEVDPSLEASGLQRKIHQLGTGNPAKYPNYNKHIGKFTRKEYIEKNELQLFKADRDNIEREIRQKCRVFICTVSMAGSKWFVDNNKPRFNCSILAIDEVSMCPWPQCLEIWHALNPFRLVLGGDSKQLSPFALSSTAKALWDKSPIEVAEKKLPADVCVMLDIEFRMAHNLYWGTSKAHYAGKVSAAPSTVNRPKDIELQNKLRKISVETIKGNHVNLTNSLVILDVQESQMHACLTTSWTNRDQLRVQESLLNCMHEAGISADDIMALTPYEGMYQEGLQMRKSLPPAYTDLSFRKVDSGQGAEKSIVILTTVRTKGQSRLGFLDATSRQNVATSRQKSIFILICDLAAVRSSGPWKFWMDGVAEANEGKVWRIPILPKSKFRCGSYEARPRFQAQPGFAILQSRDTASGRDASSSQPGAAASSRNASSTPARAKVSDLNAYANSKTTDIFNKGQSSSATQKPAPRDLGDSKWSKKLEIDPKSFLAAAKSATKAAPATTKASTPVSTQKVPATPKPQPAATAPAPEKPKVSMPVRQTKADVEKVAQQKAEAEKVAQQKAEAEKVAKDKAEAEMKAKEKQREDNLILVDGFKDEVGDKYNVAMLEMMLKDARKHNMSGSVMKALWELSGPQ